MDGDGSGSGEQTRFADLVSDRSDILALRERLKAMAKARRDAGDDDFKVDDLLAQSRRNDAAYITPADLEKAEWAAAIYEAEGQPEIHPRGLHYRILGKGYETRNGDAYENSNSCWNELKDAVKWARLLGLIDNERIRDNKNADPIPTAFADPDRPAPSSGVADLADAKHVDARAVDTGYRLPRVPKPDDVKPARVADMDADEFIEAAAEVLARNAFDDVYFDAMQEQRYYIEVWAEKADVVPESLVDDYGATLRFAGGGEFSLSMVQDAVRIARERSQDLAIVAVTDMDGPGLDMGLSISRKSELEGAIHGVEVEVTRAAVTVEQAKEYGIPGDPAKTPNGLEDDVAGAKGYETHKQIFREYAGQYPVEIRAFKSRYPEAFEREIARSMEPYYDAALSDEIQEAVTRSREDAADAFREAFTAHAGDIDAALDELRTAVDQYQDRVDNHLTGVRDGLEMARDREHAAREEFDLERRRDDVREVVEQVDYEAVLANLDVDLPAPEASGAEDPVLDTRRGFLEQIEAYRRHDMRCK